jgi:integrase
LEDTSPRILSRFLSRDAQVAEALMQAGQFLLAAASALRGEDASAVSAPLSLTLHPPGQADFCPVATLVNKFWLAKAGRKCSDRYLRQLHVSLTSFAQGRMRIDASEVSVEDVEAWLNANRWAPRTRLGYLRDVRTLYNWGLKRNLVSRNPANAVEAPMQVDKEPAIHTPEQVRTVLEFARSYDLNVCRAVAIAYFTGMRTSEVEQLEEDEIRLDRGVVEVKAAKAKCRRRRPVAIQANLKAWLALGGTLPLHNLSNTWRRFRAALKREKGIEWAANVMRHSFVSYHLEFFGNAGKTALEAGHSEQMLFAHYRAVVTAASARQYWAIFPS